MSGDDKHRSMGTVTSISADKLTVELHRRTDNFMIVGFDDMQYVAQLGSYILIPVQAEYAVCEIVNLSERDPTTTSVKEDVKDMGKAMSAKFLDVVPVGSLTRKSKAQEKQKFNFGLSVFPSLYADVLYATKDELDVIFNVANASETEDGQTKWTALPIGHSTIFEGYDVKVGIDAFFGGHVAVLGNTGSGKSCTVSSILQSLFSKADEYKATGATFLILDVNGEYSKALKTKELLKNINVKELKLDGSTKGFSLPHWLLSQEEWELLLCASERAQRPVLNNALAFTSLSGSNDAEMKKIKEHLVSKCILEIFQHSDGAVGQMRKVRSILAKFDKLELNNRTLSRYVVNNKYGSIKEEEFREKLEEFILPDIPPLSYSNSRFQFSQIEKYLDIAILYEEAHGNRQVRDYCSSMLTRAKALQNRDDFAFMRESKKSVTLESKLKEVLGVSCIKKDCQELVKEDQIIILDMSEVGDEVVELVTAVLSRMIFNLLKKQQDRNKFPVHLVLEEAHRYVAQKPSQYAIDATQIFERIAKEGRKYGMFLMVASQRPSELSRTVLSQCANFIVHRIQNPDDLSHIRQMTPFISKNVLERLASLPKQHALIFGNAVTLPTTFKVRQADPLPKSDDADIKNIWFKEDTEPAKIQMLTDNRGQCAKERQRDITLLSPRAQRDIALKEAIMRIHQENYNVYGARKVWRQMKLEGYDVARSTVERLMRSLGLPRCCSRKTCQNNHFKQRRFLSF